MLYFRRCKDFNDTACLTRIVDHLSRNSPEKYVPLTWKGNFKENRKILIYYIIVNKFEPTEDTYTYLSNDIMAHLCDKSRGLTRFYLEFLICLNQTLRCGRNRENYMVKLEHFKLKRF